MKKAADLAIGIAVVSAVVGIISRLTLKPVSGIFASAFLDFSAVCLLLAIALFVREK
jgi:hypothetical protein